MKLNTRIRLPDGRVGTICYHNLDGIGGVWGEHTFYMPPGGFGEGLPAPEFMMGEPPLMGKAVEYVGDDFEVVFVPAAKVGKENPDAELER